MPQLRQNIITGEWVVIAPERAKRPNDFVTAQTTKHQKKEDCSFCPHSENYQKNRIKKFDSKNCYVIGNKFPAFLEIAENASPRTFKIEDDFYRGRPAAGGHDVVVVKDHDLDLPTFSEDVFVDLFKTFQKRYLYFDQKKAVEYSMAIYNHGPEAGASIEHPHAQIFASNILPNLISREIHHTEKYYEHNGSCAFCDLITHEKEFKTRIISENAQFVAFTFYAARFPFEIWLMPKKHCARFEKADQKTLKNLANCLKKVFGKLNKTLNDPPLNFFLHSEPNTIRHTQYYHWHLEIAPRLSSYGGFELGSGVVIDIVSPEKAAMYLNGEEK